MDFKFAEDELWPMYVMDPEPGRTCYHADVPEDLIKEYKQAYDTYMDVYNRLANIIL